MMEREIIKYIKAQTNIDVSCYRTDFSMRYERDGEIIIETGKITKTDMRNIELLAARKKSKIRIESVGTWGIMICFK